MLKEDMRQSNQYHSSACPKTYYLLAPVAHTLLAYRREIQAEILGKYVLHSPLLLQHLKQHRNILHTDRQKVVCVCEGVSSVFRLLDLGHLLVNKPESHQVHADSQRGLVNI